MRKALQSVVQLRRMKFDKQNLAHSTAHCHIINRELEKSDNSENVYFIIF